MLSICIPVYNFNVTKLVTELHQQGMSSGALFEILVMDDASDECFRAANKVIRTLACVQYIELEENIGRSRIRNQLALKARYDYLLYMDCDAEVVSRNYINNYLSYCYKDVICVGGTAYAPQCPNPDYYLRWKIGIKRESTDAYKRSRRPNRNFSTFNFLMDRDFFLKVCFNEKLVGYGHEDTLFSFDLLKHNVTVRHIENPLRHIGLESGIHTLEKSRQGIRNIRIILNILNNDPLFIKGVSMLVWAHRIKQFHLDGLFSNLYKHFHHLMEFNLLSKHASMSLFSIWKLSYYYFLEKGNSITPQIEIPSTES